MMSVQPTVMESRLPRMSPTNMDAKALRMHPMSYVETICDWVVASGLLNWRRKTGLESKPPKTPWS